MRISMYSLFGLFDHLWNKRRWPSFEISCKFNGNDNRNVKWMQKNEGIEICANSNHESTSEIDSILKIDNHTCAYILRSTRSFLQNSACNCYLWHKTHLCRYLSHILANVLYNVSLYLNVYNIFILSYVR